jgi:hypothetical protein
MAVEDLAVVFNPVSPGSFMGKKWINTTYPCLIITHLLNHGPEYPCLIAMPEPSYALGGLNS